MRQESFKRSTRVAERIHQELMDILLRGDVRHPGVQGAVVSHVSVTDDLSLARVFLRKPGEELGSKDQAALVKAFTEVQGYFRRELGVQLKMKRVPDVRFFWDNGVDKAAELDRIFMEIERNG